MRFSSLYICIALITVFLSGVCGQNAPAETDREAAVAGSFYPAAPAVLTRALADLFARARSPGNAESLSPAALIVPHAGYIFSGLTAACSYARLDPVKEYKTIFIIGTSHFEHFPGASVYSAGDYITPLGKVAVDREITRELIQASPFIRFRPSAHSKEHSIEVQLPFLQYYLKKSFKIVPVLLGTSDRKVIESVAGVLEKYRDNGNLFILSTDFSHYPDRQLALKTDSLTAQIFLSRNAEKLRTYAQNIERHPEDGLVTPMCGWPSALVIMRLFGNTGRYSFTPLYHATSGDIPSGDKDRVVGYYSIMITTKLSAMEDTESNLNRSDKILLLKIARESLESYLKTGKIPDYDENNLPDHLMEYRGAFVTLNKRRALRGCIGRFLPDEPLYKVVRQMTIAAAVKDPRFDPVTENELEQISIDISVLSPLKKIDSADEFVPGRDGILIRKGNVSGTYLPQVADETGWTREEMLGHCSRDKAGLGWDGWKNADLYIYTADNFSEKEFQGP